jgi:S-methylmethionine-dependent homocysteine/selenocysteine methylase
VTTGPLQRALQRQVLMLDGAMGTELHRRGVDTGLPLWSAAAVVTHPNVVRRIHLEYIESGADIITTNTFRTTARTFRRAGLSDRSEELTARAVALAIEACATRRDREVLIAGCMAPLEDCYRPDLVPSDQELAREHAELAGRLVRYGVDFLLLETIGSVREAREACTAALQTGKEVMVSFLVRENGTLYSGEPLSEAVDAVRQPGVVALSLNCLSPRLLETPLRLLRSLTELPLGAYGNVGRPGHEHAEEFVSELNGEEYASYTLSWIEAGASIVGGCCGTTPATMRAVRESLDRKDRPAERMPP